MEVKFIMLCGSLDDSLTTSRKPKASIKLVAGGHFNKLPFESFFISILKCSRAAHVQNLNLFYPSLFTNNFRMIGTDQSHLHFETIKNNQIVYMSLVYYLLCRHACYSFISSFSVNFTMQWKIFYFTSREITTEIFDQLHGVFCMCRHGQVS